MSTIEASLQLEIAQYQAALRKAQGEIESFRRNAKRSGDGLADAMFGPVARRAQALVGTLGAAFAGRAIMDAVVSMERLEKTLLTLEGSGEKAAERMKELQEVARLPGLNLEQAVMGDARLRQTGVSAELSKAAIIEFSNALALVGGTAEEFGGVITALAQINSKGKVFAEEIGQIAERVPQIRKLMQEAFGTADTEAIQEMNLSFEEFLGGLLRVMGDLQRAQRGLSDEFSEMADIGKSFANDVAGPVLKTLIPAFTDLLSLLTENKETLKSMGEWAATIMGGVAEGFTNYGAFMNALGQSMNGDGGVMANFDKNLRAIGQDRTKKRAEAKAVPAKTETSQSGSVRVGEFVGPEAPTPAQRKRAAEDELRLQEQIAEIQRQARLDSMSASERSRALAREISMLEKQAASENGVVAKLELEKQILEVKNEQRRAEQQAVQDAERAAEEAKDEADRAAEAEKRLSIFRQELDIAEARAAGEDDLADSMQRQLDIAQLQARLVEEMRLGEEEALALAERQVDAAAELNAEKSKVARYDEEGRRADGRRQIKGYSQDQGDATAARARAQGRIDTARASREIPSGLDAFNAQPGLRDRMATDQMFPGLAGAFGPAGGPLAETAADNANRADRQPGDATRGLEEKLEKLVAITEQGLLGDG